MGIAATAVNNRSSAILLSLPGKVATSGSSGSPSPPPCRIIHGPNECYFPNLAGKTIASIRRSPATVFSVPDDAEAYCNGSAVDPDYKVQVGDALGALLTVMPENEGRVALICTTGPGS